MEPKAPFALCETCPLRDRPHVPTHFGKDPVLAVVGEAPGFHETRKGEPFVGKSGQLLQTVLRKEGVPYDNVFRTNVVSCQPVGNADPTQEAVAACAPRLENELSQLPMDTTIIPLGAVATEVLTGRMGKHKDSRGRWAAWQERGVLPTWHPAYVLRFPGAIRDFQGDIHRAIHGTPKHPTLSEPPVPVILNTIEGVQEALDALGGLVAFDIETTDLLWYPKPDEPASEILMLGLSDGEREYIIPDHMLFEGLPILNAFFNRDDITFVAQNGKFDALFLRREGVYVRVDFDTLLAEYALWEGGGYGLEEMALRYYGLDNYKESIIGNYKWPDVPFDIMAQYCAWDCRITHHLARTQIELLQAQGLWEVPFLSLVMPTSASALEMEWNGMSVDAEYLKKQVERFERFTLETEQVMRELSGKSTLNPRSPQQVSKVMFEDLGLPRTTNRKYKPNSTDKKAIVHILPGQSAFVDALRAYRRVHKILSSYLRTLLSNMDTHNRVHTNVLIQGTEIGRLSMTGPALQTLPREKADAIGAVIRGAVVARPGHVLVMGDYPQAELRIAGAVSGEPFLLQAYKDDRDLHMEVALKLSGPSATGEDRSNAKRFNFAFIYGGTEYSFAEDAGMSIPQARTYVRDYQALMRVLTKWKRDVFELARKQGWVQSRTGRMRRFPLITKDNLDEVRKSAPHFLISGPAADLTTMAMNELSTRWPLILNVHDSIAFEVPEAQGEACAADVGDTMLRIAEHWFPEVVWGKIDVDVVKRWAEAPTDDEIRDALRYEE